MMRLMQRHQAQAAPAWGGMISSGGLGAFSHNETDVNVGDSDHSAFAEHRAETLQRLEREQREFQEFVKRLHTAKDKSEFDEFMTQRKKPA